MEFKSTREAAQAGIGIIFQELNLYPNLSISENIFVARELTRSGVVLHRTQEQVTAELLKRISKRTASRSSNISHRLEEILRIGDYLTILHDGKLAATAPARSVDLPWIIEQMVGRDVNAPRHRTRVYAKEADRPVLEVKNLQLPRVGGGYHWRTFPLRFDAVRFWQFSD